MKLMSSVVRCYALHHIWYLGTVTTLTFHFFFTETNQICARKEFKSRTNSRKACCHSVQNVFHSNCTGRSCNFLCWYHKDVFRRDISLVQGHIRVDFQEFNVPLALADGLCCV
jgi:hypothetical protein